MVGEGKRGGEKGERERERDRERRERTTDRPALIFSHQTTFERTPKD